MFRADNRCKAGFASLHLAKVYRGISVAVSPVFWFRWVKPGVLGQNKSGGFRSILAGVFGQNESGGLS